MSQLSIIKSSLFSEELQRLLTFKPLQSFFSACIIGLLMMFLTLLMGLSSHLSDVSQGLYDKLGMYFYINKEAEQDSKIVELLQELKLANIDTEYLSHDDALQALEKKIPDIVQKFKDYNINTNLPSTLYIRVHSESQHQKLIEILPRYSQLIENIGDLEQGISLQSQEKRIMKALDFARFLQGTSIALIVIFAGIVIAVTLLLLYFKLKQFEDVLAIKKILGATLFQIRMPFLIFIGGVIGLGLLISFGLTLLLALITSGQDQSLVYFSQLLGAQTATGVW